MRQRGPCLQILSAALAAAALAASAGAQSRGREYDFAGQPLAAAIETLARDQCLSVQYDEAARAYARDAGADFRAANTTPAAALARLLDSRQLRYEFAGESLVVYRDAYPRLSLVRRLSRIACTCPLDFAITQAAQAARLSVDMERSRPALPQRHVRIDLADVSGGRALWTLLGKQGLSYERDGCGAITLVKDETVVR